MGLCTNISKTTADGRFLANLYRGRLRWDLVCPFPEQSTDEQAAGNHAVREMLDFVRATVDPELVDETRRLPEKFISELDHRGYLKLSLDQAHGGLGLSQHNAFRVISAAMTWSVSAAYVIAIHHGLGIAGILPAIPPGPMRELILLSLSQGAISGWADTEVTGAANNLPTTTATPVDGGTSHLLNGNKVFIGNGSVAREMIVTATIRTDSAAEAGLFLVDTRSVGYRVESLHEVLGFRGLPLAAIALDNVLVPTERMLAGREEHWRLAPLLEPISALGRMHVISGAALAAGKLCLRWSRQFVNRRYVDGRPLGEFDQIQRILSTTAAELFAMESVAHWCLIGDDIANLSDRHFERVASKNINSLIGWRIVDRTMSLLAAEGLETAGSKARRGAVPVPLERFLRDIRGLRIAGAVDFHVDQRAAESFLTELYYSDPAPDAIGPLVPEPHLPASGLSGRNQDHLRQTAQWAREFAELCRDLVRRHPDPQDLFTQQRLLILLSRVVNELLTMSLVLARAASTPGEESAGPRGLADIYCTMARHRLSVMWHQIRDNHHVDHTAVSDALLHGDRLSHLFEDALLCAPLER
jgi:alkylation response protein AidB-like acyl-CoA dehydrogenase